MGEINFLNLLYDLDNMPSNDSRYNNVREELIQHRVNNKDYSDGWIFLDDRFELKNRSDEVLLEFLRNILIL